jgi:hypothetical protein
MTLKMERLSSMGKHRIRLSGQLRSQDLDEVRAEIERSDPGLTLDLDEIDLVDLDAVHFLNACESQDVEVTNCSAYIREWMLQERLREGKL